MGVPALFFVAHVWPMLPWLDRVELCAVRGFLGVDCPGCGLIRSFVALAHGHIRNSIDMHPLGIVIALWLVYIFARELYTLVLCRRPAELLRQPQRDFLVVAFLVALFIQWIAKLALA